MILKNSNLERRAFGGERREADDVTEVDGHGVVGLRYHRLSLNELVRHGPGNNGR